MVSHQVDRPSRRRLARCLIQVGAARVADWLAGRPTGPHSSAAVNRRFRPLDGLGWYQADICVRLGAAAQIWVFNDCDNRYLTLAPFSGGCRLTSGADARETSAFRSFPYELGKIWLRDLFGNSLALTSLSRNFQAQPMKPEIEFFGQDLLRTWRSVYPGTRMLSTDSDE